MNPLRVAIYQMFYELWLTGADPNGLVSPHGLGATAVNLINGHLYQCTGLPSTWTDYDPAAGGSGLLHVGTVERLTTLTDTVAVGTAGMLGSERMRVTSVDAGTNTTVDVMVVEHQTSGVAAPGIGAAIKFVAETSINAPMDLGRISAAATNVTTGAEASGLDFWVRTGGAALSAKWSILGDGNWKANADNAYMVGDNVNRLQGVFSNQFLAYAASADVNPIAQLTTAGFGLGQGGGVVMDWFLSHSAAIGVPRADMATGNQLGAWGAGGFAVRTFNTDLQPTLFMATAEVSFGPGGAVALDARFQRSGTKTVTFDDHVGGSTGTLVTKGTHQTEARTLGHVFTDFGTAAVYNCTATDDVVCFDTTAGVGTVNLPAVATVPEGHRIIVKSSGAVAVVNALNVTPNGGETIDLVAAAHVLANGTLKVTLVSRNSGGVTGWYTL